MLHAASDLLFCLIIDLLDDKTHPAELLDNAYRWRCYGSETALHEAKSTWPVCRPRDRGDPPFGHPALVRQEHAAWIVATERPTPAAGAAR